MKLLVDRTQLLAAFGVAGGIVPARSPKPILQNLKLHAAEQGSTLMATDLEVGIRLGVLGVKVDAPGAVVLPHQRVFQILRSCSGDAELAIEADGGTLAIRGARSSFKLPLEDPELFPDPSGGDDAPPGFRVEPEELAWAIRRTAFATDPESTRYALGGVLFEVDPDDPATLHLVATDGRRLATQGVAIEPEGGFEPPPRPPVGAAVVPAKALRLLEKVLHGESPARVAFIPSGADVGTVVVRVGRAVVSSRLVEGRFPAYRAVFPASSPHRAEFAEAGALLSAVEQARITTSKESRGLDLAFAPGTLRIETKTADVGESHVELPVGFAGEGLALTLDGVYLAEGLKVLDPGQPVAAELTDHKTAAVFRTGDGHTQVIMPLNRDRD